MNQGSANRRSAYLTALTQEIERKLQRALNCPSQRVDLLQQLLADIALEIDDRARDIIVSRNEDGIAKAEDRMDNCLCFYEVLADHYVRVPEDGKHILDLIVQLWSQSFVSHIFALLFHKWLFEVPIENTEALLRYGSALVQGARNVFWIDIQTNTRRFLSLFRYLLEEVALVPERSNKISLQARRDLFLLISRFLFFYNLGDFLEIFLQQFPTFPNSFFVGGPADIFVIELTDQLQKLKVEPVLLHYLSHMSALQGLELRMSTSTRLKSCLYSFTSPGGPMYPTRAVRHAAWDILDFLFPPFCSLTDFKLQEARTEHFHEDIRNKKTRRHQNKLCFWTEIMARCGFCVAVAAIQMSFARNPMNQACRLDGTRGMLLAFSSDCFILGVGPHLAGISL